MLTSLATLLLAATPALAQQKSRNWLLCESNKTPPAEGLAACTAITKSRSEPAPNRAVAFFNLGQIHRRAGRLAEAITEYTASIALVSTNYDPRWLRADAHMLLRQYAEAIPDLSWCINNTPLKGVPHLMRGISYLGIRKYDEAIADFEAGLRWNNENVSKFSSPEGKRKSDTPMTYGIGLVKRKKGDQSGGDADVAAALATEPRNAELFKKFGFE